MSAVFSGSQRLVNSSSAVLDRIFTVGIWVRVPTYPGAAVTFWSLSDTGTTNNYYGVRHSAASRFDLYARGGGTENTVGITAIAAPSGGWYFILCRMLSATNDVISVIAPEGLYTDNNRTTSRTATGLDTFTLGALTTSGGTTEAFTGGVAEFWYTNSDVGIDSAAITTNKDLVRQLAYGGPFSVPHVAKDIQEYHSLRVSLTGDMEVFGEDKYGPAGRKTWTNTGSTPVGPHVPLPYWYEKPQSIVRSLTI